MDDILSLKAENLVVSRAATAIYLILKTNGIQAKKIIVPANLCYAVIYPIIYSGNEPLFCDIEPESGSLNDRLIADLISQYEDIGALIIPHMYGKCIRKIVMKKISETCRKNNILVIEDCASAMGASDGDYVAGSIGDYAVFSFGYSKTVDLGRGGLLISDKSLKDIAIEYAKLPLEAEVDQQNEAFFSRLYRLIRNDRKQTLSPAIWSGIRDQLYSDLLTGSKMLSWKTRYLPLRQIQAVIS